MNDSSTPKRQVFLVKTTKNKPAFVPTISSCISFEKMEYNYKIPIKLKRQDLSCLKNGEWLSDIVIDSYLKFIINNSSEKIGTTNSFFGKLLIKPNINAAKLKEWEGIQNLLKGEYDHFFIPIATRAHWVLFDVLFHFNIINVYDSLGRSNYSIGKKLKKLISEESGRDFELISVKCGHQENLFDCGVFILAFAEAITIGRSTATISQKEIKKFRKTIRNDLSVTLI